MTDQLPLDFASQPVTGKEAMRIGIKKVETTADALDETYRERAYEFLKQYIKSGKPFLTEDVRVASVEVIGDCPASKRLWGSVIRRAAREGLVRKIGMDHVKNVTSHNALAMLWVMNFDLQI